MLYGKQTFRHLLIPNEKGNAGSKLWQIISLFLLSGILIILHLITLNFVK